MRCAVPILLALICLSGCGDGVRSQGTGVEEVANPAAEAEREARARDRRIQQLVEEVEAELDTLSRLPPVERDRRYRQFGPRLERLIDQVKGTRLENKAVYLLADWRLVYDRGRGDRPTEELLDRIEVLPSPAFKSAGRALRVQLRLRQGRLGEAKQLATALAAELPEAKPLLALVAFHQRIGGPPGRLSGTPLDGPAWDPASEPQRWLLYLFLAGSDDEAAGQVALWAAACAGRAKLVVVTADGAPLAAAARLRSAGAEALLWASPGDRGDLGDWVKTWALPMLPCSALVSSGPERRLMAVRLVPDDLGALVKRP